VANRRIVPLSVDPARHNIHLRLTGRHPIGEMDVPHQDLYVAARPEAIGCLLDVASRVRSNALEVTSLVRHHAYQRRLVRRNVNARTAAPTHVIGMAFDISILNTPLSTAAEIRDVLRDMAAAGDLFFVAEQRQLVFHVVPAPRRHHDYVALYEAFTTIDLPPVVRPATWPVTPSHEELCELLPQSMETLDQESSDMSPLLLSAGIGPPWTEEVNAWWPVALPMLGAVVAILAGWVARRCRLGRRLRGQTVV
jgi:hypothetical protein